VNTELEDLTVCQRMQLSLDFETGYQGKSISQAVFQERLRVRPKIVFWRSAELHNDHVIPKHTV
jgi:hypothetical protein